MTQTDPLDAILGEPEATDTALPAAAGTPGQNLYGPTASGELAVTDPETGQTHLVSQADTRDLVALHAHLDEWRQNAMDARRYVDDELLRRMDKRNRHTLHEEGYTASAPSATSRTTYPDPRALRSSLRALVEAGELDVMAVEDALPLVTPEPYIDVKPARLKELAKRGGRIADTIAEHSAEAPVDRRVSVKPERPR